MGINNSYTNEGASDIQGYVHQHDIYWRIFTNSNLSNENVYSLIVLAAIGIYQTVQISQTRILLEKDEPALFERIMSSTLTGRCSNSGGGKNQQGPTGSMVLLPIERWFNTLFASVLPDAALLKVLLLLCKNVYNKIESAQNI